MSNYIALAKHPETGVVEHAEWLDDYFGKHQYGVRFSDGKVFRSQQCHVLPPDENKDIQN